MRRVLFVLVLLLLGGCTTPDESEPFNSFWVVLDGQHSIGDFDGTIIVIGGDIALDANRRVNGNVLMITGTAAIGGEISGSLYALGGDVTIDASGSVNGDVNVGGGTFERHPDAQIVGVVSIGDAPDLPAVLTMTGSPPVDALIGYLLGTLPLLILAVVLARFTPKPLRRIEMAIKTYPLVTGATGLLVFLVGLSLLVAMAFTIVLLPVALLAGFVMLLAVGIGWVALGLMIGQWLFKRTSRSPALIWVVSLGVIVFRILFSFAEMIPFIGTIIVGVTVAIGLGAVLMTRFGLRQYIPPDGDIF